MALGLGLGGVESVLNIFKNFKKENAVLYIRRILNLV